LRAAQLGYAAIATTDECSLAGVVRAHTPARECGITLIIGSRTDSFFMAASTNGGVSVPSDVLIDAAGPVSYGVGMSYFHGGGGPYGSTLFVHPRPG
jgi:hypothetical protein